MIKKYFFQIVIYTLIVFFAGYFVRSIHYKNDLSYLERGRAERRLAHERIERQLMPLMKSAVKTIDGYEEIINQNRRHPVMVFIEEEK